MDCEKTPWIEGLTIGEMLRQVAARQPEAEALIFSQFQLRWSYAELDRLVDQLARGLMGLGIGKGDHVSVWGTNWPQWPLLQFATARIGAVLVTINPAYRSSELAYVLKQSDTNALFLIEKFKTSNYFEILGEAVPELKDGTTREIQAKEYPRLRHVIAMNAAGPGWMWGWEELLALGAKISVDELKRREAELEPNEAVNIQYTSGTTGFPKGATLTHRNLLMNAYYVGACQDFSPKDRVCIPVPFYHCFGCVLGILGCSVHGAAMIIPHEYFQPGESLAAIEAERGTAVYGVPTMFIAMLDHADFPKRDMSSLRTGVMAGAPCPIELMNRVTQQMHATELTIAYGLTEASPVITQTRTEDPIDLRVHTVGRALPGVEVAILNQETGAHLGDNQPGELCERGHGTMLGYYNNPEATRATIDADGWLHSGDLAVRAPNGYYHITGRLKDMICRGGENIYPREIEEFLYTHPAVQDVAIVGVPDLKYGEETAAWIKLKPEMTASEGEIREYCRAHLAHYKVPKYVKFVSEFPQTVTGKIQKFKIREMMVHELHLEKAASQETA